MTSPPSWSLVTYRVADGPDQAGVRRADGTTVAPPVLAPYAGLADALDQWDDVAIGLRELAPEGLDPVPGAVALLSVRYPRKLICAGANYYDHIAEMGDPSVPDGWRPYFFLLPPTTALIGDGETIEIPADPAARIDWEAELAVVIGRRGARIDRAQALEHIAGYACLSDITARGALARDVALGPPFRFDWAEAKGLDTFTPLGPVTPAWLVPEPGALGIRCWVDGVIKQDGNTRDLICDVAELISAASRICTLEPGDVIATGTPAGVGAARGEQLGDGNVVRVEIDGLAPLENPVRVRAPERAGRIPAGRTAS